MTAPENVVVIVRRVVRSRHRGVPPIEKKSSVC